MTGFDRGASSYEGVPVPVEALARAPLFAGLEAEELTTIAHAMRFRSYEAGAIICREGEPGESMFLIVDGLVQARVAALEARALSMFAEDRLAGKLRQGDAIGATSLITGEPRSATIIASVETHMLELDSGAFRTLIARFPRLLENLVGILGRRLGRRQQPPGARQPRRGGGRPARRRGALPAELFAATKATSVKPVAHLDGDVTQSLAQLDAPARRARDGLADHATGQRRRARSRSSTSTAPSRSSAVSVTPSGRKRWRARRRRWR